MDTHRLHIYMTRRPGAGWANSERLMCETQVAAAHTVVAVVGLAVVVCKPFGRGGGAGGTVTEGHVRSYNAGHGWPPGWSVPPLHESWPCKVSPYRPWTCSSGTGGYATPGYRCRAGAPYGISLASRHTHIAHHPISCKLGPASGQVAGSPSRTIYQPTCGVTRQGGHRRGARARAPRPAVNVLGGGPAPNLFVPRSERRYRRHRPSVIGECLAMLGPHTAGSGRCDGNRRHQRRRCDRHHARQRAMAGWRLLDTWCVGA